MSVEPAVPPVAAGGDRRPKAAVLGSPIEHSLSPVLHRAAYRALGLDWSYAAIRCEDTDLPSFLDDAAGFSGLSLTMPLKRAVLPLLDEVSPLAAAVGAANTVTFGAVGSSGRRSRRGDNTDVAGMAGAIRDRLGGASDRPDRLDRVVVLGGGGTAAAALAACHELAVAAATVVVRDLSRADELRSAADRIAITLDLQSWPSADAVEAATLLISTVPAGAADTLASGHFHAGQLVFDVLYDPWPTALAAAASRAGADVIGGLELLVRQAGRQVELMTGRRAPIAAMREAGQKALNDRNSARH